MKLFSYWRSSCSWRVRIVLNHKGLTHELVPVNLLRNEQATHGSPLAQVPVLEHDGIRLHQSVAIMEYLEELSPGMLPRERVQRAQVRAFVEMINSGIQPLHNLAVGEHIKATYHADEKAWHAHWIARGLPALERMVQPGKFCFGDEVTLADACLVPQLYGARRYNVPLEPYPNLLAIEANCQALLAFTASHPDRHPGATT